jgi:hypothetical protein
MLGLVLLLTQIVLLPGSWSVFRTPKDALVLSGIALVVALGLTARLVRGTVTVPKSRLLLVLAALPVLQLISMLWSSDPYRALSATGHSILWVAGIVWIATLEEDDRDLLLGLCAVGVGISALVLLSQTAEIGLVDIGEVTGRGGRTGLAGNPSDFSMAATLLLPLLLLSVRDKPERALRWVLIAVLTLATVLSLSLTGIVALGLLFVMWLIGSRSLKHLLWSGVVVAVAVVVALPAGLDERLEKSVRRTLKGRWYVLFSARGDGWSAATQMVREEPVAGVGAGNYTQRFYPSRLAWLERNTQVGRRGEQATHFEWTHCDPLQHVAELGLLGVAWLAALCWAVVRAARGSPLLVAFSAAATVPFLMLHYPTHLALGMIPIMLMCAAMAARDGTTSLTVRPPLVRTAAVVLLLAVAVISVWGQLRRVGIDAVRAGIEQQTAFAQTISDRQARVRTTTAITNELGSLIDRLPAESPWLWRNVGRAQIVGGDVVAAEQSFRTAYSLWPHAEAEFGLGLALEGQRRRSEALVHLGRVCRVNPKLTEMIPDGDLQKSIYGMLKALRNR